MLNLLCRTKTTRRQTTWEEW